MGPLDSLFLQLLPRYPYNLHWNQIESGWWSYTNKNLLGQHCKLHKNGGLFSTHPPKKKSDAYIFLTYLGNSSLEKMFFFVCIRLLESLNTKIYRYFNCISMILVNLYKSFLIIACRSHIGE